MSFTTTAATNKVLIKEIFDVSLCTFQFFLPHKSNSIIVVDLSEEEAGSFLQRIHNNNNNDIFEISLSDTNKENIIICINQKKTKNRLSGNLVYVESIKV
jgi:hypothetical protein